MPKIGLRVFVGLWVPSDPRYRNLRSTEVSRESQKELTRGLVDLRGGTLASSPCSPAG